MSDYGSAQNSRYAPMNRKAIEKKQPGRVIGEIAIASPDSPQNKENPYKVLWSVDRSRKDYERVLQQAERKCVLPHYEQNLFDSCFKNWRD